MGETVICSNFGFCGLADEQTPVEIHLVACPRCAKLLASPHQLSITILPDVGPDGSDRVEVKVERLVGPERATDLTLDIDGSAQGRRNRGPITEGYVGLFNVRLVGKSHLLTATLETDDRRLTVQRLHWFGAREGILPITLPVFALLIVAIVSLWANFEIEAWSKMSGTAWDWLAALLVNDRSKSLAWLATGGLCFVASAWLFALSARVPGFGWLLWVPALVIILVLLGHHLDLLGTTTGLAQSAVAVFFLVAALITVSLIVLRLGTRWRSG